MRLPRRRTLWLSAALLLVVGVAVLFLTSGQSRFTPGVTRANIHRLEIGMKMTDVGAILGRGGSPTGGPRSIPNSKKVLTWWGEHGTISLTFGDTGHVEAKQWDDRPSASIPQRIARWFDSLRYP